MEPRIYLAFLSIESVLVKFLAKLEMRFQGLGPGLRFHHKIAVIVFGHLDGWCENVGQLSEHVATA